MRKKTIYAVLMTVLVTSFTGCGQKEDTNAVDVVVSEAETQDPDLTAEAQAAVDTLLPTETQKPVATAAPTPVSTPAPCNHNYVKEYWPAAPDCNGGGDWTMVCSICGDVGATGTDPALPHTPETRVEVDATYCDEHGVRVTYCTSCGNELGREGFGGTEHEWTTGTYEAWDEDTHTVVEKERTYCSRCGVSQ